MCGSYSTRLFNNDMIICCLCLVGESHGESYNPMNRNPQYSHAENECVWELQQLASHYHPSVALFAQTMLKVSEIPLLNLILLVTYLTNTK